MSVNFDNPQTWVEALNISPEQLGAWSAEAPEGRPLLVWCLEQGHVSVAEYLMWASETFGLAVLSAAYFDDGGLESAFLKPHLGDDLWSSWCFPVGAWDGVLFVACVEPPATEPAGTRFVLADPRVMAQIWEREHQPAPMNQPAYPTEEIAVDEGAPPPLVEAPGGLSLEPAKPFVLNFDESNLMLDHASAEPPAPPPLEREPVETGGTMIGAPEAEHERMELSIHLDDEEPMGTTPFLSPPTQLHRLVEEDLAAPPPPVEMAHGEPVAELPEVPAAPERSVVIEMPAPTPAAVIPMGGENEALATAYSMLGESYAHVCLIRFNEDQIANLHRWSPSLNPPEDGLKASINLGYPSFLRIVSKTGLPYHGYLVDSPAHREFFQALGLRDLPGCVTAVPLRPKGKMWGVLLAVGEETLQAPENLATVTQLAEPLGAVVAKAAA